MNTVVLDRELLLEKIQKISKFVPTKTVTPIFEELKLSVGAGIMEIMASDGQTQCKFFTPCKSKETFVFSVPAKLFIATVTLLRENELIIKEKNKKLEMKSGKGKYSITILEDEYPTMSMKTPTSEIALSQFNLKRGLTSTESFIDEKNPLPQLIGIHIAQVEKEIVFTGAVQAMICRYATKPISIKAWTNIVLPTDTANKVRSILSDRDEVNITHTKDKIMFSAYTGSTEAWEVMSTLQDISYPNTEALFAKPIEDKVAMNTLELSDSLKRLKLYTMEVPQIVINTGDNLDEVVLSANSGGFGTSGEEVITIKNVSGKNVSKSFNGDQLVQILKNIDDNEFELFLSDSEKKPCQIRPINTKEGMDSHFKFLITSMYNN
jgi:DNA polymerase III sliding clamp (beta) subunit (PCNA family)